MVGDSDANLARKTCAHSERCFTRPGSPRRAPPALLPLILAAVLSAGPVISRAPAEAVTSAGIQFQTTALVSASGVASPQTGNLGSLYAGIDSSRDDSIKASIKMTVMSNGTYTLDRAYLKARFPWILQDTSIRFTAGKAPLSWGKGFLFNAGDPVFGAIPALTGLVSGEYRIATDWMGVLYVPVGNFSFAELVYLPAIDRTQNRSGGRLFWNIDAEMIHSIETGYLFTEGPEHTGYLALDGSLYFDWYGAASFTAGNTGTPEYSVSFGLFRMFGGIAGKPLSFRAEGLIYPAHNAQMWYPSLQAELTDTVTLAFQGLIATGTDWSPAASPLPLPSGTALAGVTFSWTPLKGFTLSGTAARQFEKGEGAVQPVSLQFICLYAF
jgi:hypothetical protein